MCKVLVLRGETHTLRCPLTSGPSLAVLVVVVQQTHIAQGVWRDGMLVRGQGTGVLSAWEFLRG